MNKRIRTSPYLVLGVSYGASATEANRAFARRLRRLDSLPFEQEDLNWAQSLFKRSAELRSSVDYLRVPTGSATPPPDPVDGLFRPAAELAPRTTPPIDHAGIDALRAAAARDVIVDILSKIDERADRSPYE